MKEELLDKISENLTLDELKQMALDVNCWNGDLD